MGQQVFVCGVLCPWTLVFFFSLSWNLNSVAHSFSSIIEINKKNYKKYKSILIADWCLFCTTNTKIHGWEHRVDTCENKTDTNCALFVCWNFFFCFAPPCEQTLHAENISAKFINWKMRSLLLCNCKRNFIAQALKRVWIQYWLMMSMERHANWLGWRGK